MTYFLKKKKWMAWVVLLTFLFTSFMPSNILAGNSVAEAAVWTDDKSVTIEVGETITLEGSYGNSHSWNYDKNNTVAEINPVKEWWGTTNQATVKGVSAGTVTITHKYGNKTEAWNVTVTAAGPKTVTFKANGGSGDDYVMTTPETNITLPTAETAGFSREGYTLVGWSVASAGDNSVFSPDTQYPENDAGTAVLTGNVTLYAIWQSDNPSGGGTSAYFHIKLNGKIPFEPCGYTTSGYTENHGMTGTIYEAIGISNNLGAIAKNIKQAPSDETIKTCVEKAGGTFDPAKQYVQWYVIKKQCWNTETQAYNDWHVDGVIRNRNTYLVTYNPNGGTSTVPSGAEYVEGAGVSVVFTPQPTKVGYTFLGWDKNKDATTPTYQQNDEKTDSFTMPDNDVTLYAIWQEKSNVTIRYEATEGGDVDSKSETLNPETGTAKGSTATAAEGYTFEGWYSDEKCTQKVGSTEKYVPSKGSESDVYEAATYYANFAPINYTVSYEYAGAVPKDATVLPETMTEKHIYDEITVASAATAEGFVFSGWTVKEPADVKIVDGKFTMPANNVVLVGSFSVGEATEYTVSYYYQNPDKAPNPSEEGNYFKLEDKKVRTTTSGAIAFLLDEDIVPELANYQFNVAKSDVQKMVKADGSTVLNVYFDALYNVVYRYTDGETSYDVASSGYVYHYGDKVVAPGMESVDQFDGKWYKSVDGSTDEWVFADETISGNISLVGDKNTIYLYTTAKVTPLKENTIRIKKETVNGTAGAEYGFNLKLLVKPTVETNPLEGEAATTLHRYNSAMITARSQYESAQAALGEAVTGFETSMFMTTNSALTFVMYGPKMNDIGGNEIRPAVYGLTTGSSYGFESYNLFEDSFDVVYADDVDNDIQKKIVNAIKRLAGLTEEDEIAVMSLRSAYQPFAPDALLFGLAGLNTSGSALAFDFDAAKNLYVAAENLVGKRAAYQDAKAELDNYAETVGRYAVVTVNGEKYVLNGTDAEGNKLFTPDENGNYILSFDFDLAGGMFKDFTVTATTGSTVQFIITETDNGGALSTTVNNTSGTSVSGILTTGSALEYTFVNTFNGGGDNGDGGGSTGGGDGYDGPYSDDDTIIDDEEVPLAEPDVDDTDDGIEIDDGDVPLTDVPGEALEINDEQVPLGDAPKTGDANNAIPFVVLMMMAGLGLVVTRRKFN